MPTMRLSPSPLLYLLCLLTLWMSSCCFITRDESRYALEPELSQLVRTSAPTRRGIFIVIHGLNQRPSSMEPLCDYLRSQGFDTYRLALNGHDSLPLRSFPGDTWANDIHAAYDLVHRQYPQVPVHILAFSLGGLATTRALDVSTDLRPKSMVFIAPPLSLRTPAQSSYLLRLLPPLTITVPNIAPPYYRRFARTPLFWYRNTSNLYSDTRSLQSPSRLKSIPTLIIANPRDELVSLSGLRDWIHENNLEPAWRIEAVRPVRRDPFVPEHLLVDQNSFGTHEWQRFKSLVEQFLSE
jgi:esterase/lipase